MEEWKDERMEERKNGRMKDERSQIVTYPSQPSTLQPSIRAAIARVIERGVFTPSVEVETFEQEFTAYLGVKHAVGVASGSAALLLALKALGLGPGDEIISTPQVDISVSAPISQAGVRQVWVDIHPRTYNLEPAELERKITPRTRAIVATHMYGNPVDMEPLLPIARRHQLPVVEDASLALGATYRGQPVGTLGDVACFSFSPGKILSACGKAGLVTTNNAALARHVRVLSSYGFKPDSLATIERGVAGAQFEYEAEGFNARLDELQAAVLRVKLPHLAEEVWKRRQYAAIYRDMLAELEPEHLLLPQATPGSEPLYRIFVIRSPRRDELLRHLAAAGLWAGLSYVPPLHLQPVYGYLGYRLGDFPQTEVVAQELQCLPTQTRTSPGRGGAHGGGDTEVFSVITSGTSTRSVKMSLRGRRACPERSRRAKAIPTPE
ncbi:MAG: DegT/DnrJ/EryC1/StrS family aminotransferase [Anaerolineae bacterium]